MVLLKQVLHLMNKMNLPAPFRPALPTPPLPPPPPEPAAPTCPDRDLSSDESELESSEEVGYLLRSCPWATVCSDRTFFGIFSKVCNSLWFLFMIPDLASVQCFVFEAV